MARVPDRRRYAGVPIPDAHDPLRFHYWPVVGRLYRKRIDGCMALLGTGRRVLDLGYGSGTSFLELAPRFAEIHGIDTHDYGPAIARVFAQEGVAVSLRRGNLLATPYPDGHFDAVLAMSVLEHLRPEEQPRALDEIRRVLRPGGALVAGVPGVNALMTLGFRLLRVDIGHHHFSSPRVVLDAARERLVVERVVRQPSLAPDWLVTYVWFRARTRE